MNLISVVGACGWMTYIFASLGIRVLRDFGREAPPLLRSIRMELRPFALVLLCAYYLPDLLPQLEPQSIPWFVLGLAAWWLARHDKDDDDRWKRRRQKLAEQVAEVGGRLVLVPAASPA